MVKTDKNGVFTFAVPRAGWWGFSAINEEKKAMEHDGKKVDAEYGAVHVGAVHRLAGGGGEVTQMVADGVPLNCELLPILSRRGPSIP